MTIRSSGWQPNKHKPMSKKAFNKWLENLANKVHENRENANLVEPPDCGIFSTSVGTGFIQSDTQSMNGDKNETE